MNRKTGHNSTLESVHIWPNEKPRNINFNRKTKLNDKF